MVKLEQSQTEDSQNTILVVSWRPDTQYVPFPSATGEGAITQSPKDLSVEKAVLVPPLVLSIIL